MQEKTIKSILRRKIDDWCSTIDDQDVKKLVQQNAIVTGGALVSLLTGEDVNDYDVYFKTKDSAKVVAGYYVNKFKENPPSSFKNHPERLTDIKVLDEDDRIKVVVKSQGIAGESGTEEYQYFEGVNDPSEAEQFVEQVAKDKIDADKI